VADETLAAVLAAYPHLAWPPSLDYFEGFAPHEGEFPFLDVRPAMSAIYAELRLQRASPWVRPTWDEGDVAPLFAVLYGEYEDGDFAGWFLRGLRAGQLARQLPPGIHWTRTPLGATAYALEPPFPPGGLTSDGVVIADARDPNDLALFWTCARRAPTSPSGCATTSRLCRRGLRPTSSSCSRPHGVGSTAASSSGRRRGGRGTTCSRTLSPPRLPTASASSLTSTGTRSASHSMCRSWFAADEVGVLGAVEDDGYGNARLSLALPTTPFQGARPELFHERLLVRLSLLVDRDEAHTLHLPYLPDLNDWYDRELTVVRDGVRVEVDAVAVFVAPRESSVSLRLARRADVVRQIFVRAGVEATPSAAGRAVDVIRDQLGGLQGARVLRAPGVRKLLQTPKWRNWETALGEIARGGLPDQRSQTPVDVLETLLARGALVVGLKLQCPSCRVRERYALDQLGEEMRCPRCRNAFAPTRLLHDSIWEYSASGFFADEAHGAVPVLLT
jgi:hypothetical protein